MGPERRKNKQSVEFEMQDAFTKTFKAPTNQIYKEISNKASAAFLL